MTPITIAIVYYSGRGHTARQAAAVRRGVENVEGVSTLFLTSEEAQSRWDDLAKVDAIIFGAPTYMGSVSGQFKTFMDASSTAFFSGAWKNKIAAGFTNSASKSGDKLSTLIQFVILAAQHGMHWMSLDLPPGNNQSSGSEHELNRLGFWLGAAAQSNADEGPELAPPEFDLLTAEHLGQRVAGVTMQIVLGRMALENLRPSAVHPRSYRQPKAMNAIHAGDKHDWSPDGRNCSEAGSCLLVVPLII